MGDLQHYVPAAVMSQFGHRDQSGRRRKTVVAIRRRGASDIVRESVDHIGAERGLYDFRDPEHPDPGHLDRAWLKLEHDIAGTTARLEARSPTLYDNTVVRAYLAGTGVRHPTFLQHATRELTAQGLSAPQGDEVQVHRIATLRAAMEALPSWGLRILHRPANAAPFLLCDLTYVTFEETGKPRAFVWPLSSNCAVLAYPDRARLGPNHLSGIFVHLTLDSRAVDFINATAWWNPDISWVIIDPDHADYLARLEDLELVEFPTDAPYLDRSGGLFD